MSDKQFLFFMAQWCTPCRAMRRNLDDADVMHLFKEVDIDDLEENWELLEKHRIIAIPTIVRVSDNSKLAGVRECETIKDFVGGAG